MNVKIMKLTDKSLANIACSLTTGGKQSIISLRKLYMCEHSPIRTQEFLIICDDVPTFVVNHFVRHKVGVEPWVQSNRVDRNGGNAAVDRNTPIKFGLKANAQALINIARKRLCFKASPETRELMQLIKMEMLKVDPELHDFLVPECVYRKGCHELKSCGFYEEAYLKPLFNIVFDMSFDENYRRNCLEEFFKS